MINLSVTSRHAHEPEPVNMRQKLLVVVEMTIVSLKDGNTILKLPHLACLDIGPLARLHEERPLYKKIMPFLTTMAQALRTCAPETGTQLKLPKVNLCKRAYQLAIEGRNQSQNAEAAPSHVLHFSQRVVLLETKDLYPGHHCNEQ